MREYSNGTVEFLGKRQQDAACATKSWGVLYTLDTGDFTSPLFPYAVSDIYSTHLSIRGQYSLFPFMYGDIPRDSNGKITSFSQKYNAAYPYSRADKYNFVFHFRILAKK